MNKVNSSSELAADSTDPSLPISISNGDADAVEGQGFLREGVERKAFGAFLYAALMAIASLVFINANQIYIMVDILNYPREEVGQASGNLVFADELFSLGLVSLWGALSDRVGRRWIFSLGFIFMGLSILLHPLCSCVFPSDFGSFFGSMLAVRLVFAMGASATTAMITACIGDFAGVNKRARVAGMVGFATGLGAIFAAFGLGRIPDFLDRIFASDASHRSANGAVKAMFLISGGLQLVNALITFAFLHTPATESHSGFIRRQQQRKMSILERIHKGVSAMRNPLVCLAYASGYVARADSIALNLFIPPWVDRVLTEKGICPSQVGAGDVYVRCKEAKRLSSSLIGTGHLAMLLAAPFFGIISDRIGSVRALNIPALAGFIAFGVLAMSVDDPQAKSTYLPVALAGMADIGMIIVSMAIIAQVSTDRHRGAIAGVYSFFGALGIIVTSKLGGFLLDRSSKQTHAFYTVALPSGLVLLASLLLSSCPKAKEELREDEP